MMVIFLVGLVSMILMRTLRKDYARYSKEEEMDDMVRSAFAVFSVSFFKAYCFFFKKNCLMCVLKVGGFLYNMLLEFSVVTVLMFISILRLNKVYSKCVIEACVYS